MMGNTKKIQEMLMNSIFDVFEKMFFVFLEPRDEDIQYDLMTSIQFKGPLKGEIRSYLSTGMASVMAQNMLGLEPREVTDRTMEDCAKEALNMIAGNFLNKLEPEEVFDLSIPAYAKKSGKFAEDSHAALSLSFDSDNRYFGIVLNLEAENK
ncbi:MAG: chemotaxis protein CheX [Deltaproteobacteria bacterium]|nr:chemotaxis protein CheX [Deltaproteobacteria bacterium]